MRGDDPHLQHNTTWIPDRVGNDEQGVVTPCPQTRTRSLPTGEQVMNIYFNNKLLTVPDGQLIIDVAKEQGITIPTLCFHSDLAIKANCRVCMVELEGRTGLFPACSTLVEEGMKILTDSEKVMRARTINLELIYAQHKEECSSCLRNDCCKLGEIVERYQIDAHKYANRKAGYPKYAFGKSLIFDTEKCIDCRNCVDVCDKQHVHFFELTQVGEFLQVDMSQNPEKDCVFCGQCVVHCPVGALEGINQFIQIEEALRNPEMTVVFQYAPSIRTSIGEDFAMEYGTVATGHLVAAIKKLGADYVFDVCVGADVTTVEEAKELKERLEQGGTMPMFTSCCPAWVKYVEFFHPELLPHLTTVRSPQMILGGLIKTQWASEKNCDPKTIVVVSVLPCLAKKYEVERPELAVNGQQVIDYTLTTRELSLLLKKHGIDLATVLPEENDQPFGDPTGSAVIYGASGGVMESALRTAVALITGKPLTNLEYTEVRGLEESKKAVIAIEGKQINVAVVNGLGNAEKIIEELKKDPHAYDYIEVMACPGGCIGGGGQPIPTSHAIRKKRAESLYSIDTKTEVRSAHESPIIKNLYSTFLNNSHTIHATCHTSFVKKEREVSHKALK